MPEILELLRYANELLHSFAKKRETVKQKAWEEVILALDTLTELTTVHAKAINEVTAPILSKDSDIAETAHRYQLLVSNDDFPRGYSKIRGVLEATRGIRGFQTPEIKSKVQAVLNDLTDFQNGVFTLEWDSFEVADAIKECADVVANPHSKVAQLIQAGAPLIRSYGSIFFDASTKDLPKKTKSTPDVIQLVKTWCKAWQRDIKERLYGGRHLDYSISQLKMQRFD